MQRREFLKRVPGIAAAVVAAPAALANMGAIKGVAEHSIGFRTLPDKGLEELREAATKIRCNYIPNPLWQAHPTYLTLYNPDTFAAGEFKEKPTEEEPC